ncbi:nucleoporin GLE1 [Mytilus galloprovincialis]|uniref:mRNA export factor GLE1 n=1 Tax=Mytilus galloprovincialis TaxID=29158 RepID=A0A8B6BV94_MYTGA|nr:nucleoporin GLE1 [Mytilus galloprovincialis]
MDISKALKNTPKGSLTYDRRPPSKEFFEHCSPPPSISKRFDNSPNNRLTDHVLHKHRKGSIPDSASESSYDNVVQLTIRTDSSSPRIVEIISPTSPIEIVSPTHKKNIIPVSPEYTKSILAVKEYENSLDKEIKIKVYNKQQRFTEHTKKLQNEAENKLSVLQRNQQNKAEEQQQETELQFMQQTIELQEKQRKLKEDHREHAQMLQKKHEKLKEEIKRKEKERQERIQIAQTIRNDIATLLERLKTMYEQFTPKDRLPESLKKALNLVNNKLAEVSQMASRDVDTNEVVKMTEILKLCLNAYEYMRKEYDELTKKIKEEQAKEEAEKKARAEIEAKARAEAAAAAAKVNVVPPTPGVPSTPLATSTPAPSSTSRPATEAVLRCVDQNAFTQYTNLQVLIKKAEEESKTLFNNPQMKKMKFDIQKSINTPINNISPVSGDHLNDQLTRLLTLLAGRTVDLSGRRFSLSACPQALPFCKYLIAKMVVKKGEEQVSALHSSAFAIAAVTVGLLAEHPDILPMLLGHFHQLCPYTVPYHISKTDGQSREDFYKSLGYKYDSEGNAEKQDQFLKRMSGLMRLYASVMVAHPPRGPNPYGTEHAWEWLSMVMNIEPLPDITATMTFDLLEVTGHALYRDYRKQFVKLLHVLAKEFFPKLKRMASPSGGGPISRLEDFLQNSLRKNGNIRPPEGLLNQHFWMT